MNDDNAGPGPTKLPKKDILTLWNQYLRQRNKANQSKSQQPCTHTECPDRPAAERCADSDGPSARESCSAKHVEDAHAAIPVGKITNRKKSGGYSSTPGHEGNEGHESMRRSNPSSLKREGSRSRSASPPKRSKSAYASLADEGQAEFSRPPSKGKSRLWNTDEDARPAKSDSRSNLTTNHQIRVLSGPQSRASHATHWFGTRPPEDDPTELIKQPETRPISQEQLVAEVKGIYAGLVMVENKCIEVDTAQNAQTDPCNTKLNNDQWQALIALHRTLLHEHHDFFLASQHPSASPALRRLASKYAMPARMWRHGIHSFLELLRHRLPASLEHMLTFTYLAYSMMALLYETVPAFEDTWIECLGDLGRYRMAIEDDNVRDREIWTAVGRGWYRMVTGDNNVRDREIWTAVGRGWYSKASDKAPTTGRLYHHFAILARPNALQQLFYYNKALSVAVPLQSARESKTAKFGATRHHIPAGDSRKNWDPDREPVVQLANILDAELLGKWTCDWGAFHHILATSISPMASIPPQFPWKPMSWILNTLAGPCPHSPFDEPYTKGGTCLRPLPEGHAMRDTLWADKYHPSGWFSNDEIEDDERLFEATAKRDYRTIQLRGLPSGELHTQAPKGHRKSWCQQFHSSPGLSHHGHVCRAGLCDGRSLEVHASQGAFEVTSMNILNHTSTTEPHRWILGSLRSSALSRLLRFFAPFFMLSFSLALTTIPRVPWHTPKVILLAASAMGSFGTGMVCLNFDMAPPSSGIGPADMSLRVVSSVLVGVLFVGYVFWFIGQRTKRAQFKRAQFKMGASLAIVFWIVVRLLRASSSEEKSENSGGDYLWLDELNLLACASVVAGIANAERSIFSSAESEGGDDNDQDGLRESRHDDPEGQAANNRRVGECANGSATGPSVMESVSTAFQVVAGN